MQAAARHWAAIRTELADPRLVYSLALWPKICTIMKSQFLECRAWISPRYVSLLSPALSLITGMKYEEVVGKKVQENVHLLNTKLGEDSNSNATVEGLPSQSGSHFIPYTSPAHSTLLIKTEGGR